MFACPAWLEPSVPQIPAAPEILAAPESADLSLILREAVREMRDRDLGGRARILAPPPASGLLAHADRALALQACLGLLDHAARRVGYGGLVLPALDSSSRGVTLWIVWDEPTADPGPLDAVAQVRDLVRAMGGDLTFNLAGSSRALTLSLPPAQPAAVPRRLLFGATIRLIGGDPAEIAYARRALVAQGAALGHGRVDAALLFAEAEPARLVTQLRNLLAEPAPPPVVVVADADRPVDPIQMRALHPSAWLDRPAASDRMIAALHQAIWPRR